MLKKKPALLGFDGFHNLTSNLPTCTSYLPDLPNWNTDRAVTPINQYLFRNVYKHVICRISLISIGEHSSLIWSVVTSGHVLMTSTTFIFIIMRENWRRSFALFLILICQMKSTQWGQNSPLRVLDRQCSRRRTDNESSFACSPSVVGIKNNLSVITWTSLVKVMVLKVQGWDQG